MSNNPILGEPIPFENIKEAYLFANQVAFTEKLMKMGKEINDGQNNIMPDVWHTPKDEDNMEELQADKGHGDSMSTTGQRFNQDKPPMQLLPWDTLKELSYVYAAGIKKGYEPRSWEKGFPFSETAGSLMRHLSDWMCCRDYDEETGCLTMLMVAWNALALATFQLRFGGTEHGDTLDDRLPDWYDWECDEYFAE